MARCAQVPCGVAFSLAAPSPVCVRMPGQLALVVPPCSLSAHGVPRFLSVWALSPVPPSPQAAARTGQLMCECCGFCITVAVRRMLRSSPARLGPTVYGICMSAPPAGARRASAPAPAESVRESLSGHAVLCSGRHGGWPRRTKVCVICSLFTCSSCARAHAVQRRNHSASCVLTARRLEQRRVQVSAAAELGGAGNRRAA